LWETPWGQAETPANTPTKGSGENVHRPCENEDGKGVDPNALKVQNLGRQTLANSKVIIRT